MDIQEAIEWFSFRKKMCLSDKCQDAENIALAALQEQAEREKGCEYCRCSNPLLDELGTTQIDYITGELWHTAQVDADDIYDESVQLKFCPMCGRRLK